MVADACTALDGQINFKDYDTNGDGYVDAVILLYAGNGEQYTHTRTSPMPSGPTSGSFLPPTMEKP